VIRLRRIVLSFFFATMPFVLRMGGARAQTATPSPTPSVSVQVNAKNAVVGLLILTAFAAGGYYTAKWIRRPKKPRPPGPWFGGWKSKR